MFFKFPSTPYIEIEKSKERKDKVLSDNEVEKFLKNEIYIEEKIDGANLGISFDIEGNLLFQNRGSYLFFPYEGQWKMLDLWIKQYEDKLFDVLANRYILFGEWCYVTHSIFYDSLPNWFVGFDIFDKTHNKFLSVEKRNIFMKQMDIPCVPMLGKGMFTLDELKTFIGKSKFGKELCEGIYLRQDEGDFLKYRAKVVRKDFQQRIDVHWSKKKIHHNQIKY